MFVLVFVGLGHELSVLGWTSSLTRCANAPAAPYNPKNKDRRLHRHPAFFGTLQECLEDCCEYCPEPKDDDEKKLQEDEDASYVMGRVQ